MKLTMKYCLNKDFHRVAYSILFFSIFGYSIYKIEHLRRRDNTVIMTALKDLNIVENKAQADLNAICSYYPHEVGNLFRKMFSCMFT